MALADLCYRCPDCGHDPMAGKGDRAWCSSCGFRVRRRRNGIYATRSGHGPQVAQAPTLVRPMEPLHGADHPFRHSARAMVSWRIGQEPIWRGGKLRGFAERMGAPLPGTATLDREAISIESSGVPTPNPSATGPSSGAPTPNSDAVRRPLQGQPSARWGYLELKAMQTSSSSLQISLPGDRLVQLRFTDDSPKRWEDLLQQLIREAYRRAGRGHVHEFQPRVGVR